MLIRKSHYPRSLESLYCKKTIILCVVSQLRWFVFFHFFPHKISNFTPPTPSPQDSWSQQQYVWPSFHSRLWWHRRFPLQAFVRSKLRRTSNSVNRDHNGGNADVLVGDNDDPTKEIEWPIERVSHHFIFVHHSDSKVGRMIISLVNMG